MKGIGLFLLFLAIASGESIVELLVALTVGDWLVILFAGALTCFVGRYIQLIMQDEKSGGKNEK